MEIHELRSCGSQGQVHYKMIEGGKINMGKECCKAGYTPFVDENIVGKTEFLGDIPEKEMKKYRKMRHERREHRCHYRD